MAARALDSLVVATSALATAVPRAAVGGWRAPASPAPPARRPVPPAASPPPLFPTPRGLVEAWAAAKARWPLPVVLEVALASAFPWRPPLAPFQPLPPAP